MCVCVCLQDNDFAKCEICGLCKHFIICSTAQRISQQRHSVGRRGRGGRGAGQGMRIHYELPCKRVLQHDKDQGHTVSISPCCQSVSRSASLSPPSLSHSLSISIPIPISLSCSLSASTISGPLGQTTNDFAVDSCLLPFGEFSVNYGCNKLYNISQHIHAFMRRHTLTLTRMNNPSCRQFRNSELLSIRVSKFPRQSSRISFRV